MLSNIVGIVWLALVVGGLLFFLWLKFFRPGLDAKYRAWGKGNRQRIASAARSVGRAVTRKSTNHEPETAQKDEGE